MIIPIVLGVTFILFVLMSVVAGSSIGRMPIYGGGDALDSIFEFLRAGENLITRFVRYCYNIFFHFDFGRSLSSRRSVSVDLVRYIKNTVFLLLSSVGTTLIAGIPIGVYSAIRKNRMGDRIINVVTLILSSIPPYTIALLIALFLSVYLRVLPVISSYNTARAYIMPTLTIWLGGISTIARMTRTSMLEVLDKPYIKALRAKGLKESDVIYKHALKNALVPVIAALGGLVTQLLCGAFVVEHFFNIPGLGTFILRSVSMRDHYELLGCTVVLTVILTLTNIVVDLLYMFVNPQIKRRSIKERFSLTFGFRLKKGEAE